MPHVYYYDVTRHEQNDFDRTLTNIKMTLDTECERQPKTNTPRFHSQHKTDQETKGGIFCSISSEPETAAAQRPRATALRLASEAHFYCPSGPRARGTDH